MIVNILNYLGLIVKVLFIKIDNCNRNIEFHLILINIMNTICNYKVCATKYTSL